MKLLNRLENSETGESLDTSVELFDSKLEKIEQTGEKSLESAELIEGQLGDANESDELYELPEQLGADSTELYEVNIEKTDDEFEVQDEAQRLEIDIGGDKYELKFDAAEAEKAYRQAMEAGNMEAASRLSAIYELATFKDELELGEGNPEIAQIAGKYGEIVKSDPKGYEAHHMPPKSSLEGDINEMPAISLRKEDHMLTDSYSGRANKEYKPYFPSSLQFDKHKYEIGKEINNGNYMHVVRCEVYNIRDRCGNNYDGALSKYFNAASEYISKYGVPVGKEHE